MGQPRQLAARARAAGVEVDFREYPGLWHVFHGMAGVLPRADRALDELAGRLERRLDSGRPGGPAAQQPTATASPGPAAEGGAGAPVPALVTGNHQRTSRAAR